MIQPLENTNEMVSSVYSRTSSYQIAGDSVIAMMIDSTVQFYTSGQTESSFIDGFDLNGQMVDEFKDILSVVYTYHTTGTTGSPVIGVYSGSEVDDFYQYLIDDGVAEADFYDVIGGGCITCGPTAERFPWRKNADTLRKLAELIEIWL